MGDLLERAQHRSESLLPAEQLAELLGNLQEHLPQDPWSLRVAGQELAAKAADIRATALNSGASLPQEVMATTDVQAFVIAALLADRLAVDGYADPRDSREPKAPIEQSWLL